MLTLEYGHAHRDDHDDHDDHEGIPGGFVVIFADFAVVVRRRSLLPFRQQLTLGDVRD